MTDIPTTRLIWRPSYRIIPTRYPPIDLFERVADPGDLEAVWYVESLTNPRLRQEAGDLMLVPAEDRVSGPGTSIIMASFTHRNPDGSRFSDGTYGVYYTAYTQLTAIKETLYHREVFLRASGEAPMELDMRVYLADIDGELHDIRGLSDTHTDWYHHLNYNTSQTLGRSLREINAWGIVYHSVRHKGGECAGIFRPPVIAPTRQGPHLTYVWDGKRIARVYEKRDLEIPLD